MTKIAVVHLVRASNGSELLSHFMESYEQNPAGIEHDLVIVFKGFVCENNTDESKYAQELDACELILSQFECKKIHVIDSGYDIDTYMYVANSLQYDYFCFLNSYSIIMDKLWLKSWSRCSRVKNVKPARWNYHHL